MTITAAFRRAFSPPTSPVVADLMARRQCKPRPSLATPDDALVVIADALLVRGYDEREAVRIMVLACDYAPSVTA